jgi:hypothetical protein
LLPAALFTNLDFNAVLDARDSDPQFENDWLQSRDILNSTWEAVHPSAELAQKVEEVQRESFLITSRATVQHELASYVSDDFLLIARASALSAMPPFVV